LYYHVVCDGYAFVSDSAAVIAIGVDSATIDGSTLRLYGASGVLQTGLHTERVYQLGAGSHTFQFRGTKQLNTGLVNVNYHTITVTVYTDGGLTDPIL
jgi:hypothetical protein